MHKDPKMGIAFVFDVAGFNNLLQDSIRYISLFHTNLGMVCHYNIHTKSHAMEINHITPMK